MITKNMNAGTRERFVEIPAGRRWVKGVLNIPRDARGVVAFAHGSGSGRFSPRNKFVAHVLQDAGLATLLIDLLEEDETQDRGNVFDIELLSDRIGAATHWLGLAQETRELSLGCVGASTGAAAALVAAARRPGAISAVVSRGGRPDLAWNDLPNVIAPTLLIVGECDEDVWELNRQALTQLSCPSELIIVPEATHLFEEPGTLEQVAHLAQDWFLRYLGSDCRDAP